MLTEFRARCPRSEEVIEPLVDLLVHLKAMFASMGKELDFVGIPDSPEGID